MTGLPRLRQVALVTHDSAVVEKQLPATFGWSHPFRDPGVGQFGLDNAVFAAADTFIEVLSPIRPDTAAGRHMQRPRRRQRLHGDLPGRRHHGRPRPDRRCRYKDGLEGRPP